MRGGGENRILLAPGQDIRPCDAEPIDYPSWAPGSDRTSDGQVNGLVEAYYVHTQVGDGAPVYGKMRTLADHDEPTEIPANHPNAEVTQHD